MIRIGEFDESERKIEEVVKATPADIEREGPSTGVGGGRRKREGFWQSDSI